ncbi:MAG: hypothetical protein ACXV79_08485 [Methylobacter sp.]
MDLLPRTQKKMVTRAYQEASFDVGFYKVKNYNKLSGLQDDSEVVEMGNNIKNQLKHAVNSAIIFC